MSKLVKKLRLIGSNIVMATRSLFWKKDPTVVLIGAWFGEKFADNSRFLYQYLHENKEKFGLTHIVWVTANEDVCKELTDLGYEAYVFGSDESIRFHKLAKYHIICNAGSLQTIQGEGGKTKLLLADIESQYSWRAKRVNLWHGVVGFKGVSFGSQEYKMKKRHHPILTGTKEMLYRISLYRKFVENPGGWGDCYYLTTSPFHTQIMTEFFQLPRSHYIETAFPRVSTTVELLPIEKEVIRVIGEYKKAIIYLPTFRGKNSTFDFDEASIGIKEFLGKNNILWIQKYHSASTDKTGQFVKEGNILNLPHDFDVNTIISSVSLMVTDYSSAAGDAMYYFKPLVFYVPDFDEYKNGERGFMIDPEEIMCGPKAFNTAQLQHFIEEGLKEDYKPDKKYCDVRKKYYAHEKSIGEIWQDITGMEN